MEGALILSQDCKTTEPSLDSSQFKIREGGVEGVPSHRDLPPTVELNSLPAPADSKTSIFIKTSDSIFTNETNSAIVSSLQIPSVDLSVRSKTRPNVASEVSCSGLVIRCPFSGKSIDLPNEDMKVSTALSPIETVCEVEQQSLKKPQINGNICDEIVNRHRKLGVIDRPAVIERRSEDKKRDRLSEVQLSLKVDFPIKVERQQSLDESRTSSPIFSNQHSLSPRTPIENGDLPKPRELNVKLLQAANITSSCPGLNSFKYKPFGSTCTLTDPKRPGTTSPTNYLPSKVTERTRAPDQSCVMYGMLLLSACQFGQVNALNSATSESSYYFSL